MKSAGAAAMWVEMMLMLLLSTSHAHAALSGKVMTADGKPVVGAVVTLLNGGENKSIIYASLHGTELKDSSSRSINVKTDAEGSFQLPAPKPGGYLVVTGPAGFAAMPADHFALGSVVTVQAWGRVEGVWLNHGRPMGGERMAPNFEGAVGRWIWVKQSVVTDQYGHFTFDAMPPGIVSINWVVSLDPLKVYPSGGAVNRRLADVVVKPGQGSLVRIVTDGHTVAGRLVSAKNVADISGVTHWNVSLEPDIPGPPKPPKEADTPEAMNRWYDDWSQSEAGKRYAEAERNSRTAVVAANGAFQAEAVVPGKYVLRGFGDGPAGIAADVRLEIEVPGGEAGYDVGDISYAILKSVKVGQEAPPFTAEVLGGGRVSLTDFRGKYVLLDFWAVWCGPCVAETPNLMETHDAYGADPHFVMLSLSLDDDISAPRKFALQRGTNAWRQAYLGNWSKDQVHKAYGIFGIPEILLVGPDGRIIATHLRGSKIKAAVGKALGH